MFTFLWQYVKNPAFTMVGAIWFDIILTIIILITIIVEVVEMKREKYRIIYTVTGIGFVAYDYAEDELFVYEKDRDGRYIKAFEVPTVQEGIEYLKSVKGE